MAIVYLHFVAESGEIKYLRYFNFGRRWAAVWQEFRKRFASGFPAFRYGNSQANNADDTVAANYNPNYTDIWQVNITWCRSRTHGSNTNDIKKYHLCESARVSANFSQIDPRNFQVVLEWLAHSISDNPSPTPSLHLYGINKKYSLKHTTWPNQNHHYCKKQETVEFLGNRSNLQIASHSCSSGKTLPKRGKLLAPEYRFCNSGNNYGKADFWLLHLIVKQGLRFEFSVVIAASGFAAGWYSGLCAEKNNWS